MPSTDMLPEGVEPLAQELSLTSCEALPAVLLDRHGGVAVVDQIGIWDDERSDGVMEKAERVFANAVNANDGLAY